MESKALERIEKIKDMYKKYKRVRERSEKNKRDKSIKRRIEEVEEEKFRVIVAGGVSSGKSTFINAILGKNILPTGERQTTSSIIKVNNSNEKKLKVEYADGSTKINKEKENWNKEVRDTLKNIGSVPEKYRDVPTTVLKMFRRRNKSRWKENLRDVVDEIYGDKSKNPRSYGKKKLKNRCLEYLNKEASLDSIPVEIEVGLPFGEELRRLQIIDSPGVHAVGGVEEVTHEYIHKADAILFLRKASGAVEDSSFLDFVSSNVDDRNREAIFLVLTDAYSEGKHALRRKRESYENLFEQRSEISKDNIIAVDSVAEIVSQDVQNKESLDDVKKEYTSMLEKYEKGEKKVHPNIVEVESKKDILMESMWEGKSYEMALEVIRNLSNFRKLYKKLSKLEDKSIRIKIESVTCTVLKDIEKELEGIKEKIEIDESAIEDKRDLEREIEERKKIIDNIKDDIVIYGDDIKKKYTQREHEKKNMIDDEVDKAKKEIKNLDKPEEMRKRAEILMETGREYMETWINNIYETMMDMAKEKISEGEKTISIPDFEVESDRIEEIKEECIEEETERCLWRTERREVLNKEKYRSMVREHMCKEIKEYKEKAWKNFSNRASNLISKYISILKTELESKKEMYESKKREKIELEERKERAREMRNVAEEVEKVEKNLSSYLSSFRPKAPCLSSK